MSDPNGAHAPLVSRAMIAAAREQRLAQLTAAHEHHATQLATSLAALTRLRDDLLADLRRVDAAVVALGGKGVSVPRDPRAARTGSTYQVIRACIQDAGPGAVLPVTQVWKWAEDCGWWVTTSLQRKNTIATAMARLAEWDPPELIRLKKGVYRVPGCK